MRIFTSREINTDPKPWLGPIDNSAAKRYREQGDPRMRRTYKPRPEFGHPVNRILVQFRISGLTPQKFLDTWGVEHEPYDMVVHARKVLVRLAKLARRNS